MRRFKSGDIIILVEMSLCIFHTQRLMLRGCIITSKCNTVNIYNCPPASVSIQTAANKKGWSLNGKTCLSPLANDVSVNCADS